MPGPSSCDYTEVSVARSEPRGATPTPSPPLQRLIQPLGKCRVVFRDFGRVVVWVKEESDE